MVTIIKMMVTIIKMMVTIIKMMVTIIKMMVTIIKMMVTIITTIIIIVIIISNITVIINIITLSIGLNMLYFVKSFGKVHDKNIPMWLVNVQPYCWRQNIFHVFLSSSNCWGSDLVNLKW